MIGNAGARVYGDAIRQVLGRALSRLDAEPTSRSYGSFDRTWWCWKFTDFSASRFQEGAYLLAWLYTSDHAPEGYLGNEQVLRSAEASVRFWKTLQHADGSFDEAYPFERSLAATAFTGFYIGAAAERLASHWSTNAAADAEAGLRGAADWLSTHSESHAVISNHLAAAAAALQVAGERLGSDRYQTARDRYLETILKAANLDEGWFREYDGADPGYQSHAMFYLADLWRRTGDSTLGAALKSACRFMGWFAHPDGTLGGEYASRGTKFAYPAAFEMLAPIDPAAAALAAHTRRTVSLERTIGPAVVDAWNLFPLLNNYLFAVEAAGELGTAAPLPWTTPGATAIFKGCGLAVIRRGDRLTALGPSAGGALKIWNPSTGALEYQDCGFAEPRPDGVALSQAPTVWTTAQGNGSITFEISGRFRKLPQTRFDPWRFAAFRAVSLTVGRLAPVGRWLKDQLVRTLIRRRDETAATLSRQIALADDGRVTIEDRISGAPRLMTLDRQVPVHMGSSRYAHADDWLGARVACPDALPAGPGEWRRTVTLKP